MGQSVSKDPETQESPYLAKPSGPCCLKGTIHEGEARGTWETIADVETYISKPPAGKANGHILLYFPEMCVYMGPESSDLATIFHSLNHQSPSLGRTLILQLFGSSSSDFFGRLWILRPDGYSFFPNGLLSQTVCSLSTC